MTTRRALRLAIVGGGPRGLYALERVSVELRGASRRALDVTLYEPIATPGAGPNYDPRGSDVLRMNFAARHVDAWSRDGTARDDTACDDTACDARPDLVSWLATHHPERADGDAFVPRALVGEYLHATYRRVVVDLRGRGVAFRHLRRKVTRLETGAEGGEDSGKHRLHAADGTSEIFDEVLLVTGHASSRRDGWLDRLDLAVPTINASAKAGAWLDRLFDPRELPTGAVVAMRGFALTAIDVVLALFAGRGGRWERLDVARYRALDDAARPLVIMPFSRTGRPMLAKPDPRRVRAADDLEEVWRDGRHRLVAPNDEEPPIEAFLDLLATVLVATADEALRRSGERPGAASRLETCRRSVAAGPDTGPDAGERAAAAQRRSVEVAVGRAPVDAAWALAEAWRRLYPAIVERVSHRGLSAEERPDFDRLAAEMERLAFGPPPEHVAKLLALRESGWLDFSRLAGAELVVEKGRPRLVTRDGSTDVQVDAVVDAVTPAPGCDERSPLLGPLLREGRLRHVPGTHGVDIDPAGRPHDAEGRPVPGLAVIGRAAEGCVLGHDTLSRTLHRHLDRWARAIVRAAPLMESRSP